MTQSTHIVLNIRKSQRNFNDSEISYIVSYLSPCGRGRAAYAARVRGIIKTQLNAFSIFFTHRLSNPLAQDALTSDKRHYLL